MSTSVNRDSALRYNLRWRVLLWEENNNASPGITVSAARLVPTLPGCKQTVVLGGVHPRKKRRKHQFWCEIPIGILCRHTLDGVGALVQVADSDERWKVKRNVPQQGPPGQVQTQLHWLDETPVFRGRYRYKEGRNTIPCDVAGSPWFTEVHSQSTASTTVSHEAS